MLKPVLERDEAEAVEVARLIVQNVMLAEEEKDIKRDERLRIGIMTRDTLCFNNWYEGVYAIDPAKILEENPNATRVGIHWVIVTPFAKNQQLLHFALDLTDDSRAVVLRSRINHLKLQIKHLQEELRLTRETCEDFGYTI